MRWAPDRTRLLLDVDGLSRRRRPPARRRAASSSRSTARRPPLGEGQRDRGRCQAPPARRLQESRRLRLPGPPAPRGHPPRRQRARRVASCRSLPTTPPWPVRVKRWAVTTIGAHLPETSAALLAGLLLGERTALPARDRRGLPPRRRLPHPRGLGLQRGAPGLLRLRGARRCSACRAGGDGASRPASCWSASPSSWAGSPPCCAPPSWGSCCSASVLLERESQLMNALALAALAAARSGARAISGTPASSSPSPPPPGIIYLAPADHRAGSATRGLAAPGSRQRSR